MAPLVSSLHVLRLRAVLRVDDASPRIYHVVFGWRAPYGYTSLPVVLGTLGGIGLLVGPAGLFALRARRDRALADPAQRGLDVSFIAMLFMTSAHRPAAAGASRAAGRCRRCSSCHLAFVLALFLMLPYGKFVHGIYRTAALMIRTRRRPLEMTARSNAALGAAAGSPLRLDRLPIAGFHRDMV